MERQSLEGYAQELPRVIIRPIRANRFRQWCLDKMAENEGDARITGVLKYLGYELLEYAGRGFRKP